MADRSRLKAAIWTIRVAFLSIGLISTVLLLKIAIPTFLSFFDSVLPRVWFCFCILLSPPYLYIVVNFIIISIAASSSYHNKQSEKMIKSRVVEAKIQLKRRDHEATSLPQVTAEETLPEFFSPTDSGEDQSDYGDRISSRVAVRESLMRLTDKMPLTENKRKAEIRRLERSSQPLKSVGVSKQPLARRLKKSYTWETKPVVGDNPKEPASRRELRKSDTFNDAASSSASSSESSLTSSTSDGFGLRRENSLSQDELNRRFEAFIKKVNDEIRLQGQESYNLS